MQINQIVKEFEGRVVRYNPCKPFSLTVTSLKCTFVSYNIRKSKFDNILGERYINKINVAFGQICRKMTNF